MKLKKHKDFLNESIEDKYYGYISDISQIEIGNVLICRAIIKDELDEDTYVTVSQIGEDYFTTIDGDLSIDVINNFNKYDVDLSEEENGMDEDEFFEYEEVERITEIEYNGTDEKGFYYIDNINTGGHSYYRFTDNSKNLSAMKSINKYKL